ncbi:MAG: LIC12162 family protein [bacterium]
MTKDGDRDSGGPFLAATALEEFWDARRPLLFLGEWCRLHGRRGSWAGRDHEVLPYPWDDPARKARAALYCRELHAETLPLLADHLNRAHGERRGLRYWRIIIGPWLLGFIEALYDRFVCLSEALAGRPGLDTLVLDPASWITPRDWYEFTYLIQGDAYNLQLYSQLLEGMGRRHPSRPYRIPYALPFRAQTLPQRVRFRLKNIYSRGLDWVGRGRPILLCEMAMPQADTWRLCRATGFRAWPMGREILVGKSHIRAPEGGAREGLGRLPLERTGEEFPSLFVQTLPVNFPSLYLEGYAEMRDGCAPFARGVQRVLVSSQGWKSNERFKFIAAEGAERGARLVCTQHGGATGTCDHSPMEEMIVEGVDDFISWGFSKSEAPKAVPLPDPKLQRLMQGGSGEREAGGGVLFVGNTFPRYAVSFRTQPISSQVLSYIKWQLRFFRALPEELRRKVLVRPYPGDVDWRHKDRLSDEFTGLRFDDFSQGIIRRLESCRLLVVDNPQTTLVEALALNRPTVLFYDTALWGMRPHAERLFGLLAEAGILCHDPEAAASHVLRVKEDPETWWGGEAVQRARREFLEGMVIEEPDWVGAWKKALASWSASDWAAGVASPGETPGS